MGRAGRPLGDAMKDVGARNRSGLRVAGPLLLCLGLLAGPALADPVLSLEFTVAPAEYTPGRAYAAGESGDYTLEVENTGTTTWSDDSLVSAFPAGVTVQQWTCSATAGSACGQANGSGNLPGIARSIAADGKLTFTFQASYAADLLDDPLVVTASANEGPGNSNPKTASTSADRAPESDVSVSKSLVGGGSSYTPGASASFSIVIGNAGPTLATGIGLSDAAPTGMSIGNWSCVAAGDGSVCPEDDGSGDLDLSGIAVAPGGNVTYTVPVSFAASATADPLVNTATITVPAVNGDTDDTNHSSAVSLERDAQVDLDLSLDPSSPTAAPTQEYVPGSTGNALTVRVSNSGPSDSVAPRVSVTLPAQVTSASWSCAPANCTAGSGTGTVDVDLSTVAVGTPVDVNFVLGYDASASAATIDIVASVAKGSSESEADTANNSATNRYTIRRETDFRLAFDPASPVDAPTQRYVPGTQETGLALTVTNDGPSDASGASLVLAFPPELDAVRLSCSPAAACDIADGEQSILVAITLASGAGVSIDLSRDFGSDALAPELDIEASIEAGAGQIDPDLDDNNLVNRYEIDRQADIEVSKAIFPEATSINPGTAFEYRVTVRNNGPSDLGNGVGEAGLLLTDLFPPGLLGDPETCAGDPSTPCWAYCPGDGGSVDDYSVDSCPVELIDGAGNAVDRGFRLRAGSSSEFRAYVAVGGTASGSLQNTATVRILDAGVTELDPEVGNSSSVSVNVELSTDIEVAKTDGVTSAVPGTTHTYTVTVRNTQFQAANNVGVLDELPIFGPGTSAGFVSGSISWQCRAFDGACCNHNSSVCGTEAPTAPVAADVLDASVDLPGQSRVVFTITGTLDPRASGFLENTASVTIPPDVIDAVPGNNSATDDDTELLAVSGLSLRKTVISVEPVDPTPPATAPFRLQYRIQVGNDGPGFAQGAQVTDPLDALGVLLPATVSWTCAVTANPGQTACSQASGGGGALDTLVDLDPGGAIEILMTVDTTDTASGQITNTATVSFAGASASDTVTTGLIGEADLVVTKSDFRATAVPGEETSYVITVRNEGPAAVFDARVQDIFPSELENVSWTCEATTPVPGDLAQRFLSGPAATSGDAVVGSNDGRSIYVASRSAASVYVFLRQNVPGADFGAVQLGETETQDVNNPNDPGGTVTGMADPVDLALATDGGMLYVLSRPKDGAPAAIAAFTRTTLTPNPGEYGLLSFAGSVSTGVPASPGRIVVTADNLFVSGDNGVAIYRRDPVNGMPIFVASHTDAMPATPRALAVSAARSRLLVGSDSGNVVAAFAINTNPGNGPVGSLSHLATLSRAEFNGVRDLRVAAGTDHLYVAGGIAARISLVDLTDAGLSWRASTAVADATALSGSLRLALAPDGEHLFSVNAGQSKLVQFRRDTTSGGIAFEAQLELAQNPGLASAVGVAVTSDGRHVLAASAATTTRPLTVYSRRAPEPLFAFIERDRQGDSLPTPPGGNLAGLRAPSDLAVSPDGQHVYAISLQDSSITVFRRHPTRGLDEETAGEHLVWVASYTQGQGGFDGLASPMAVQVSRDGRSVYVSSEQGNSLAVLSRNIDSANTADFGKLSFAQVLRDGQNGVDGLFGARGIATDRDDQHVYVAASFEAAIGIFRRNPDRSLSYIGVARDGVAGVSGLAGIRDLAVSRDGRQLLGVGFQSNAVTVFQRGTAPGAGFGLLTFRQSLVLGANDGLAGIALPAGGNEADNAQAYVVAENSSRLYVLRRIIDPGNPADGTLLPLFQYQNNAGGIVRMSGPRDVKVSADGRKVYVAAQFGHSVLAFDRDANRSSAGFGSLSLLEVRTNEVDGVDGIGNVYAVALSPDSRNTYAAGFGSNAVASFVVGTGSRCSASGGGDIDDLVDIGAGGTVVYRATATIRPDATGVLSNTAVAILPDRFEDPNPGNNSSTDLTNLTPQGDLSVSKTNNRVSVVAGEIVTYEIEVRNAGPSNLVHGPGNPVTLTDLLPAAAGFEPGSASWTCLAAGSGALDFVERSSSALSHLEGVSGLTLVPDPDDAGPLGRYLAAASVLGNSLSLFRTDPVDGRLSLAQQVVQGGSLNGQPITALEGARAVVASGDGRFLYVASRISDAISVFGLSADGSGQPRLDLLQVQQGIVGLDQALHLALSPGGEHLYVAGANDNAVAVFSRNAGTGLLTWIESEQNGVNDPGDAGGTVAGLDSVEFVAVSPDGAHLYAVSGSGGSVALFNRDAATGRLSFRNVRGAADFGVSSAGASSLSFAPGGSHAYLTAANANRVLVLQRNTNSGSGNFGNLTFVSSVAQGVSGSQGLLAPRRAIVSADGLHLYVTAQGGGSVAWYIRNPQSGGLSFLGLRSNESAGVEGLGGATGLVLDAQTNQLYLAGTLEPAIAQFARQADSFCSPSGTGEIVDEPLMIAAGGSVRFLLTVRVREDFSGTLTNTVTLHAPQDPNPGNNSATDADPVALIADLSISKDDGLAEYDGLGGAVAIAGVHPHLYVAGRDDNAIGMFRVLDDPGQPAQRGLVRFQGVLRSGAGGVAGLAAVADLMLSADAAHLYAVSPVDNSVATFSRDVGSGELSFVEIQQNGVLGVTGLAGARALAQSPDGRHVYVAGGFANAVAVFTRNHDPGSAGYGRLSFKGMVQNGVGGVDGIGEPIALRVSPDGKHVYVLGAAADSVAVFLRNPNPDSAGFGLLSYQTRYLNGQGGMQGLGGVRALQFDAAGANLYVLGSGDASLARLARNEGNGQLGFVSRLRDGEDGVSGLAGASRLRWSPGQSQLLVAATALDAVLRLDRAPDGSLAFAGITRQGDPAPGIGGNVLGLGGVSDIHVAGDGLHLYSVAGDDDALAVFGRDAGDGELDFRDVLIDGLGGVAPGEAVTYLIVATNHGPSDVASARVVDTFPDAFASVSWTCTASGGAGCIGSGNGNIDTTVSLPVGGRVIFAATGVVGESASGRLVNTATVSALGVSDPVPGNNSATDDDTVLSPAMNLVAEIEPAIDPAVPGSETTYLATVRNLGPTYASGATVSDAVPAALFGVAWTCEATPVAGALAQTQALALPERRNRAIAVDALGRHVYAAGEQAGTGRVTAYRRDPLSGALVLVANYVNGSGGVAGINGAADVVLAPDQRYVYVAGAGSDAIAVFARDAQSGELEFVAQYQDGELGIDGLGGVRSLLFSPGGAHLYAAGALDQAIAVFAVNAGSGLLSQIGIIRQSQAGVDGLAGVADLAWSPGASHLLAVASSNQSLAAFARAGNGQLSFTTVLQDFELSGPFAGALADPVALTVHQDQVWVASTASGRVARFRFDSVGGVAFVPELVIANGMDGIDGMALPRALFFEADQARLYVAAGGGLSLFSLLDASPRRLAIYRSDDFPILQGAAALALSPNGRQLYSAANQVPGGIGVFARERGSRCPIAGGGGLGRQRVDIAPGGALNYALQGEVFANALGELRYELRVDAPLPEFELDPSNNVAVDLRPLSPAPDLSIAKTDERDEVVAGLPLRYRLSMGNAGVSDALRAQLVDLPPLFPGETAGLVAGEGDWRCAANLPLAYGAATDVAQVPELAGVTRMVATPDGSRIYAVSPSGSALLVLPRLPDGSFGPVQRIQNGTMLDDATVQGLEGASSVALSGDGSQLLVTAAASNSLLVFSIDEGGALGFQQKLTSGSGGVSGLSGAAHAVVSADDRWVFVAASAPAVPSHSIAVFRRETGSGSLSFVERVADGLGTIVPDSNVIRGVRRLHLSEDGAWLYAVAPTSNALSRFEVDPATGRLTYRGVLRSSQSGLSALAAARDLVAAPGDGQLYAIGDGGVVAFARAGDGSLSHLASYTELPQFASPRALARDALGSRLYLADAAGAVHVFARDWADGRLEHRFRLQPGGDAALGLPEAMLHVPDGQSLYVSSSTPSRISRLQQLALSRCLQGEAQSDRIETEIDLGVGGWADLEFDLRVHPSARGTLRNEASVWPGAGSDPVAEDNLAFDESLIRVVSDISVTKTGPAQAVAGERLQYQISVHNEGPSDALGLQVIDALHPALGDAQWSCTASAGSSCPAEGGGSLAFSANVLVGGRLDIGIDVLIDPAFVGALPNRVELLPEPGAEDPTPEDQAAEVETEVIAIADVSVQKDNGLDAVVAGEFVRYVIAVDNAGPSDAPQVRVRDLLPGVLLFAEWTCSASASASCPSDGEGTPDFIASLPAGASLELVLDARLSPSAEGELVNTATAQVLAPAEDPDLSNNAATDSDPILVVPDISLELIDPLDPFDPRGSINLPYRVVVRNAGPSEAREVVVELSLSAPAQQVLSGPCTANGQQLRCELGALNTGSERVVELAFANLPDAPSTFTVDGVAQTSGNDPELANNFASQSTTLVTGGDANVTLSDGRSFVLPGQVTTYVLTVTNIGSQPLSGIAVSAPLPPEILGATWTCTGSGGATCTAAGNGDVADTIDLSRGQSAVYRITATVRGDLDPNIPQTLLMQASADVPGDADINLGNNHAVDVNEVRFVIFGDGFEDIGPLRWSSSALSMPAEGCSLLQLRGERLPRAAAGPPQALVEGVSADGSVLLKLETQRRGGSAWLRLSQSRGRAADGSLESGWMRWPGERLELDLRVDPAGIALRRGAESLWQAPLAAEGRPARWRLLPARVEGETRAQARVTTCGVAGAGE
jgi:uncharacterized repeat protein (TIGR01451 family)